MEKFPLKSGDVKKLSIIRRYDGINFLSSSKSLKRRKFGRSHNNCAYFNLSSGPLSHKICICLDGQIKIIDDNSTYEFETMLPFTLPSNYPSTSCSNKSNDSALSNQNELMDDYLKVVQNFSSPIITKKSSNYKLHYAKRGIRRLQRHLNVFNLDSNDCYKDDSLTASTIFHINDKAKSSITVYENKDSLGISFNTMLNNLQDLSIENNKIQMLPENITEQDEICKKLADLPLTDQCEISCDSVFPKSIVTASFSSPENNNRSF